MKHLFALVLTLALPLSSFAGGVKDTLLDHQEAIIQMVELGGGFTVNEFKNSDYSEPTKGNAFAITSVVSILDNRTSVASEKVCTTQFKKVGSSFGVSRVYCQ